MVPESVSCRSHINFFERSILVGSHPNLGGPAMFMLMELSTKQSLDLLNRHIDSNPPLILIEHDARIVDPGISQPLRDTGNSLLLGSECIVDLLWRPVLAVFVGGGIRADFGCQDQFNLKLQSMIGGGY